MLDLQDALKYHCLSCASDPARRQTACSWTFRQTIPTLSDLRKQSQSVAASSYTSGKPPARIVSLEKTLTEQTEAQSESIQMKPETKEKKKSRDFSRWGDLRQRRTAECYDDVNPEAWSTKERSRPRLPRAVKMQEASDLMRYRRFAPEAFDPCTPR